MGGTTSRRLESPRTDRGCSWVPPRVILSPVRAPRRIASLCSSMMSVALAAGCVGTLESDPADPWVVVDGGDPGTDGGRPLPTADGSVDAGPPSDGGAPVDGGADAGAPGGPCDDVTCGANELCSEGLCICTAGFARIDGRCEASPVGDPASHTQEEVCSGWSTSAAVSPGYFTVSDAMCDAGELSPDGVNDGMRRTNYYRWLAGLGPAAAAAAHAQAQHCALVSAWNPVGPGAHSPDPSAVCYTPEGAAGAGSSNIAWGVHTPVSAIDAWMDDWGNETTMGHRRWILNPPLSNVQLGVYHGGTSYGGASCMSVFGSGGSGPRPDWVAYPPPGFSPAGLPGIGSGRSNQWTFHAPWSFSSVTVSVTRMSDGADLPVTILPLSASGGFGYPAATSWIPMGWSAVAGETYRVVVTAGTRSATYDVRPVDC